MRIKTYCILFILFLINCFTHAQELIHYNLSDGLSSIELTDIAEDENFLWIATSDGLNRFDGRNFKIYKSDKNLKNSLSGNNIESLYFDSQGLLWIGLKTGGLDVYDPKKDIFYNIRDIIDIPAPNRVFTIYEDSRNNMWLGTWEEGLFQLEPKPGSNLAYTARVHYPGYIVSALTEKPKGFLRIGTYYGMIVYNIYSNTWTDLGNQDKAITQFLPCHEENAIWTSSWSSGLLKISWDQEHPENCRFSNIIKGEQLGSIYRIMESDSNTLFLGTWGKGLMQYSPAVSPELKKIQYSNFDPSFINCLYRDRHQNIWIGSFGEGLFKFNSEKKGIYHFPANYKLPKPAISIASIGQNQALIGTQGAGVYRLDLNNKELTPEFEGIFTGNFESYILTMHADKNRLIIGHDGYGIQIGTRTENLPFTLQEFNLSPQLDKANVIYEEKDSGIWIGTKQKGLLFIQMKGGKAVKENYRYFPDIGHEGITGIVPSGKNQLFISSQTGLFIMNTSTGEAADNRAIISGEAVYNILGDDKNKCLWIGTSTNLLCVNYDAPDSVYNPFSFEMSPRGAVRTMILDSQKNLWFGVGERLFCKMSNNERLLEINALISGKHTILSSASIQNKGMETLVFGTSDDLLVLDPEKLLQQPEESGILLTRLEIDHKNINVGDELYGHVILHEALEYTQNLSLSHKCKWISLSFIETDWDIFKASYQFRIKNFSDTWQLIDLDNPVTFSQLMPGKYVLEIRTLESVNYSPVNWSMNLEILPPWWKTGMFRFIWIVAVFLLGLCLLLFLNNRMKRRHILRLRKIEKEKQEELLREKESFITGLSHDLLTTFSLILAPVNDLIRENEQSEGGMEKLKIIKKNTAFLSDIFGTIFDYKRAEYTDKQVKENTVEIVSFCSSIVNAFEYLAISKKIDLSFRSDLNSLLVRTDQVKIERILYNLLSNALKYTPASGMVSLSLTALPGNTLQFEVSDTGRGIDLSSQKYIFDKFYREPQTQEADENKGLGLGLFIVRKFVDLLKGTIRVDSAPNDGTRIRISIPVKPVHLLPEDSEQSLKFSFSDEKSTILLAEDNKELLEYTTEKLKAHFNVIPVSSGQEALTYLAACLPEIIITDVMMPGLDGLTLTKEIKQDPRYSDIFVIILSAKSSTEDELTGYKQGADIYLKKPIDLEVLLSQLINIHKTRQLRKSQLLSEIISKDSGTIEFDPKESFLKWALQVIEDNLMDPEFSMDNFASEMNISKSVLHRKFKVLVGQTPNHFLRLVRLRKSVELLKNMDLTISEIAYMSGFNQSHYFIKCFKEVFGTTPKSYRKNVLHVS